MFPSTYSLPNNFIDMSTMSFPLSPLLFSPLVPMLADSPPSEAPSLNDSLLTLLTLLSSNTTPVRKERKKRARTDYCKLCMKTICEEGKRSQGPSRHVLQYHMDAPKFFCPHCEFTSNYDKAHITTHMKCMHKGSEGQVGIATDPAYVEKFTKMRNRCFGASEDDKTFSGASEDVKAGFDASEDVKVKVAPVTTSRPFSVESLLAPSFIINDVTPPYTPSVSPSDL